jgi:hypothetical protein
MELKMARMMMGNLSAFERSSKESPSGVVAGAMGLRGSNEGKMKEIMISNGLSLTKCHFQKLLHSRGVSDSV